MGGQDASKPVQTPDLTPNSDYSPAFAPPSLETSGAVLGSVVARLIIALLAPPKSDGCQWGAIGAERRQKQHDDAFVNYVCAVLEQNLFTSSIVVLALWYASEVSGSTTHAGLTPRDLFLGCLMVANKVLLLLLFFLSRFKR
jgi:hypothetical protein